MTSLLKKPSAWAPIAISIAALVLLLGYVAIFGVQTPGTQADEGTAARLFQLLMLIQAVGILFFAVSWIPRKPKEALQVLALQITAALIPMTTLFVLEK